MFWVSFSSTKNNNVREPPKQFGVGHGLLEEKVNVLSNNSIKFCLASLFPFLFPVLVV